MYKRQHLADSQVRTEPACYNNLNGLYLYDGTFTGVFSRLGPKPTISKDMQLSLIHIRSRSGGTPEGRPARGR